MIAQFEFGDSPVRVPPDNGQTQTEVTVCLRCVDAEDSVGETAQSVLRQQDVCLELLAVDDGSRDQTLGVLSSLEGPRFRYVAHAETMGSGFCNNLAVRESKAPFLVFLKAGEVLLPGALGRLLMALRCNPVVGQTVCFHYMREDEQEPTMAELTRMRRMLQGRFDSRVDYQTTLLQNERMLSGVRGYRREVFEAVGIFTEDDGVDVSYDFSLRLLEKFQIQLLREFLYYVRPRKRSRIPVRKYFENLHRRRVSRRTCDVLLTRGKPAYLSAIREEVQQTLAFDCRQALVPWWLKGLFGQARSHFKRRLVGPFRRSVYRALTKQLQSWPLPPMAAKGKRQDQDDARIVYYIWEFPVLSQTFVQREVAALIDAGVQVCVLAEQASQDGFLDGYEARLRGCVRCLPPPSAEICASYRRHFRNRCPWRYVIVCLYVLGRRYLTEKNVGTDRRTLDRALLLAGVASELGADHIHSPWADQCAFVALLAARLLGISYSVQARAHDIHRNTFCFGLQEKFQNARFVVTNTRYNVDHIRTLLGPDVATPVHLIYNGVDLRRFPEVTAKRALSVPVRILCVARLIEQKGLVYLLGACQQLRERGYAIQCNILGGPEDIFTNYYIQIQQIHRRHGLQDVVRFHGSQPFAKVLEAYRSADIFVLPCVIAEDGSRDITPNSLIEAMTMRLPVISTTVTGVPEIVEDRVSGVLVPPADTQALTDAIIEVIENDTLRRELARNARIKIERQFQVQTNIGHYVRLFGGLNGKS